MGAKIVNRADVATHLVLEFISKYTTHFCKHIQ